MRQRRRVDTVDTAAVPRTREQAVADEIQRSKVGKGGGKSRNAGADNPNFQEGLKMKDEASAIMALSDEAFEDMEQQRIDLFKAIEELAVRDSLSIPRVMILKDQARRVARQSALLNSMFARARTDKVYRKRLQEPSLAAQMTQVEKAIEGFQGKLLQMMGDDPLHEAKLDKLKSDGKPATINFIVEGTDLDKSHLAAAGVAE